MTKKSGYTRTPILASLRRVFSKNTMPNLVSGFTFVELLVVLAIMTVLVLIVMNVFVDFRKNQALQVDTETIASVLGQARSQTLSSKAGLQYGVHIGGATLTLFSGATYNLNASSNQDFALNTADATITANLSGGGSDVVFSRLSGETAQDGTIAVSSATRTRTVTIYKTGLIEIH